MFNPFDADGVFTPIPQSCALYIEGVRDKSLDRVFSGITAVNGPNPIVVINLLRESQIEKRYQQQ
jgi:hypothetical protein